jgi:hypothetical protein
MALPPPSESSTALVTGASSGIGAELARCLARRGHGVTLVARRVERLEELAAELRSAHGVRAETIACDLSSAPARAELLERVEALGLAVDVLVNNAGFGTGGYFQRLDLDRELELVRVNIEALVELCGRHVPGMVERGRGAVLNVASTAAFQPLPRQATYSASKSFVLAFTEALHSDLRGTGVQATVLCPGPVRTEFADTAGIGEDAESVPAMLWTEPDFVAEEAVKGLERGRRVVVPGLVNRVGAVGGAHTPRGLWLRVAERVTPVGRT